MPIGHMPMGKAQYPRAQHCPALPQPTQGATAAGMRVAVVPSLVGCADYPPAQPEAAAGVVAVLPSLLAFQPEQFGLPPFDDLVHGVIPMCSPIRIKGTVVKGFGRGSKVRRRDGRVARLCVRAGGGVGERERTWQRMAGRQSCACRAPGRPAAKDAAKALPVIITVRCLCCVLAGPLHVCTPPPPNAPPPLRTWVSPLPMCVARPWRQCWRRQ